MNRRGFFGAIAAAVAGAQFDPERLLWRPEAKLISIPKPRSPYFHRDSFVLVWDRYSAAVEAHHQILEEALLDFRFMEGARGRWSSDVAIRARSTKAGPASSQ